MTESLNNKPDVNKLSAEELLEEYDLEGEKKEDAEAVKKNVIMPSLALKLYSLQATEAAYKLGEEMSKLGEEITESETKDRQDETEARYVNALMNAAANEDEITVTQQKALQARIKELLPEQDSYRDTKETLTNQIAVSFQSYQELGGKLDEATIATKAKEYVEQLPKADLAWAKNEIDAGGIVDLISKTELPDVETQQQAKTQIENLVNKLQAKLPYETPYISDELTDAKTGDIIGDNREEVSFALVSRRKDAEYGGTVEQQKDAAKNDEANVVSLSPEENLQRLYKIAIETEKANAGKSEDEKKEAVRTAIVDNADYGYARNFNMDPVRFGGDLYVLYSNVSSDGQVFVDWSDVRFGRVGCVGAVK